MIPEFGEFGEVINPEPDTKDHVPVPTAGILPAIVALVIAQILCEGPAFDVVGFVST